jgi:hypothetical protein
MRLDPPHKKTVVFDTYAVVETPNREANLLLNLARVHEEHIRQEATETGVLHDEPPPFLPLSFTREPRHNPLRAQKSYHKKVLKEINFF